MNNQEELWRGKFGDAYHARNPVLSRDDLWRGVLGDHASQIKSAIEFGAGKGENLAAIRTITDGACAVTGVEINKAACSTMQDQGICTWNCAAMDVPGTEQFDLVVTRGFLIHVPGCDLLNTLRRLHEFSTKYICIAEYYSPVRREVKYQGLDNALWADDFAGLLLEMYPDLELVHYGFKYWRDNNGQDLTFFLLKKRGA